MASLAMAAPLWLLLENSLGGAKSRSQEISLWLFVAVVWKISYRGFVCGGGKKKSQMQMYFVGLEEFDEGLDERAWERIQDSTWF